MFYMDHQEKKSTSRLFLLSFADTRYAKSLVRLHKQAEAFPFTEVVTMTEKDLPKDFRDNLHPKRYPRGYGYWKWKSYLVDWTLADLQDGDVLVYADAGALLNAAGMQRFKEYIDMARACESGILTFQQQFLEKDYAKGDLTAHCGVYDNKEILCSYQLWGGVIIINKYSKPVVIIKEWTDICINHFQLITDKRSLLPNASGFIENRHDQAAMSLTFKKYPHVEIPWWEVDFLYDKDKKLFLIIQYKLFARVVLS